MSHELAIAGTTMTRCKTLFGIMLVSSLLRHGILAAETITIPSPEATVDELRAYFTSLANAPTSLCMSTPGWERHRDAVFLIALRHIEEEDSPLPESAISILSRHHPYAATSVAELYLLYLWPRTAERIDSIRWTKMAMCVEHLRMHATATSLPTVLVLLRRYRVPRLHARLHAAARSIVAEAHGHGVYMAYLEQHLPIDGDEDISNAGNANDLSNRDDIRALQEDILRSLRR